MAKNVLFNFIDQYIAKSTITFANCESLEKDSNLEDHDYYRFELNRNNPTSLHDGQHTYTLVSHHISVYETERRSTAVLSQYHYTAYFTDEGGTEYQLHAYFNDKNELTTTPIFSVRQDNGQFTKITSNNLIPEFIDLAISNSEPLMTAVKKRLTNQVQALEKRYKKLEMTASHLSTSIRDNYTAYIQTLGEIASTAKLLSPLVNHNFYRSVASLTHRMKSALVQERDNKQTRTTSVSTSPSKTSEEQNKGKAKEENTVSSSKRKTARKKSEHLSKLDGEIGKLIIQLKILETGDIETRVIQLGSLIAQLHGLSLLLEDKKNTTSLQSVQRLHEAHRELYATGENLFRSLLMSGQFELATRLPPFYYLLNGYLEQALENRNHDLLSFILKHGDFAINSQAVTVKGKSYPSAAQCCMSLHSEATPMVDCLSVLIAQGASITSGNGNSLPIAYTILATPHHPLRKALVENREKTFLSIQFYKQLITSVTLHGTQVKGEKRRIIENELASYQVAIKGLINTPINAQEKSLQVRTMQVSEKYSDDISRKVLVDPEVTELVKKLHEKQGELLRKLPRLARREYNESRAKNLENLDKALEIHGEADNFEDRKRDALDYFRRILLLLEKQIELTTLKGELDRYRNSPRGISLMKQFFELLPEVEALERLHGVEAFSGKQQAAVAVVAAPTADVTAGTIDMGISTARVGVATAHVGAATARLADARRDLAKAEANLASAKIRLAAAQKKSEEARETCEKPDQGDEQLTGQGESGVQFRFFSMLTGKKGSGAAIVEEVSNSESSLKAV